MKARLTLVLVSMLALAGLTTPPAQAGETVIAVEFVDEGTLDIAWQSGSPAFLVDGESPALAATSPAVVATATFALAIQDSRADESRNGYVISLQASPFTADGVGSPISPGQLMVADVTGAPEDVLVEPVIGAALDSPVTLLIVPNGATAIDTTLAITIAMTLLPGTTPGTYAGTITFDVLPWAAP